MMIEVPAAALKVATFLPYLQRTAPALSCERIAR